MDKLGGAKGAGIALIGAKYREADSRGEFYIKARGYLEDDTEFTTEVQKTLCGHPSGKLTWGGKPIVVLTASSYNASSRAWYRKWNDGWTEQGGVITSSAGRIGDTDYTITLNLPMKDTNYYVLWRFLTAWSDAFPYTEITKTTSSFTMHIAVGFQCVEWQVKGFTS